MRNPLHLLLEHISDVGDLWRKPNASGKPGGVVRRQASRRIELLPVGVREILVEGDLVTPVNAGHRPRLRIAEQCGTNAAAELVVNMRADTEREVDALRLESRDLFTEQVNRCRVVLAHVAKELLVTLVAAEDGVGKIKENNCSFSEECVALVLLSSLRHRFASGSHNSNGAWVNHALPVAGVARTSARKCGGADVGAAVPGGALPELLGALVGLALRLLESCRFGLPWGERISRFTRHCVIGSDGAGIERL